METPNPGLSKAESYAIRISDEIRQYEACVDVHDLPEIFHYWSNKHLRPKLEPFGFSTPTEMFRRYSQEQHELHTNESLRFASIGSGNCAMEVELASNLLSLGLSDFVIDCIDLNPAMLARGAMLAAGAGLARHIHFVEADLNLWSPAHEYNAIYANQTLHHILNLEGLFDQIRSGLKPGGSFIISDMIGRNGLLRWPEALEIVHEFWRELPPSCRYNHLLQRYEELCEDRDCSTEGFEAIRSQDILPLLISRFHFRLFIGFANVIDPFVDRAFGPNFNPARAWDRTFIDRVHYRDELEISAGRIKPTHMLAVVCTAPLASQFRGTVQPAFCVRSTTESRADRDTTTSDNRSRSPYNWMALPNDALSELEIACVRLKESEERIETQRAQIAECTAWARRLETELAEWRGRATERTAWAHDLDRQLSERTAWALELDAQLSELRTWGKRLDSELAEERSISGGLREYIERSWRHRLHKFISRFRRALLLG